ncbi:MAG: ParA family protein [Legionella sp.]|nr:ParA family protein [Legionella sp.]
MPKPILISFFANKGGVGKTTTLHEFACVLSKGLGYRVLVVDADAQCDLTRSLRRKELIAIGKQHERWKANKSDDEAVELGIEMFENGHQPDGSIKAPSECHTLGQGLLPLVSGDATMENQVANTTLYQAKEFGELYLLSGDDNTLHKVEDQINQAVLSTKDHLPIYRKIPALSQAFIRKLAASKDMDFVLIDLNPGHSALNQILLMGSDYYIIPILPEYRSRRAVLTFSNMYSRWDGNLQKFRTSEFGMPEAPNFLGYVCQRVKITKYETAKEAERLPKVYKGEIAATRNAFKDILMKNARTREGFTLPPAPHIPEGNSFAVAAVATGQPFSYINAHDLEGKPFHSDVIDDKSFDYRSRYLYYIKMILRNMKDEDLREINYESRFPREFRSAEVSLIEESKKRKAHPNPPSLTSLKARDPSDNASSYFQRIRNEGGGDCAFISLGITRDDLVDRLLAISSDADARRSLSEEIYESIISRDMPSKKFDGLDTLLDTLQLREAAVDTLRRQFRERYPGAPKEGDNTAGTVLHDWLLENDRPEDASRLSSLAEIATAAQTDVLSLLGTEQIYKQYVELLRKKGTWMGYASACLYAKVKGDMEVRVWEMVSPTELRLKKHQISLDPQAELINILYERGCHFLRLRLVPAPDPNIVPIPEEKTEYSMSKKVRTDESISPTQPIAKRTRAGISKMKEPLQQSANGATLFGSSAIQARRVEVEKKLDGSVVSIGFEH